MPNDGGKPETYAIVPDAWHRLLSSARLSGQEWCLVILAAQDQRNQAGPGQGFYTNPGRFNLEEIEARTGISRNSAKKALARLAARTLPGGAPVMEPTVARPGRGRAQVWRVNLPTQRQAIGGTTVPPSEDGAREKETPRQGSRGGEVQDAYQGGHATR